MRIYRAYGLSFMWFPRTVHVYFYCVLSRCGNFNLCTDNYSKLTSSYIKHTSLETKKINNTS